jgi:hypothetical protein
MVKLLKGAQICPAAASACSSSASTAASAATLHDVLMPLDGFQGNIKLFRVQRNGWTAKTISGICAARRSAWVLLGVEHGRRL